MPVGVLMRTENPYVKMALFEDGNATTNIGAFRFQISPAQCVPKTFDAF